MPTSTSLNAWIVRKWNLETSICKIQQVSALGGRLIRKQPPKARFCSRTWWSLSLTDLKRLPYHLINSLLKFQPLLFLWQGEPTSSCASKTQRQAIWFRLLKIFFGRGVFSPYCASSMEMLSETEVLAVWPAWKLLPSLLESLSHNPSCLGRGTWNILVALKFRVISQNSEELGLDTANSIWAA